MKFAREGYLPAAVPAVTGLVLAPFFGWWFGAAMLVLAILVLLFFRDPVRVAPEDPAAIVAPADGRVLSVERKEQGHRLAPRPIGRKQAEISALSQKLCQEFWTLELGEGLGVMRGDEVRASLRIQELVKDGC